MKIPKDHPRYRSLVTREKLVEAYKQGVLAPEGLIAHGRGESFDYLLGEKTVPPAEKAERASAAMLLNSKRPVLSVNGNVAVLAGESIIRLAEAVPCKVEVNLFHRTEERISKIAELLEAFSDMPVLGRNATARIPDLDQPRGICDQKGIFSADTVLVALEDGDRTEALVRTGKDVIAIDLNPLCRTSQKATITIVDEVTRALPRIIYHVEELKENPKLTQETICSFDNSENLQELMEYIRNSL
ncbi:MAG: phosphopantothenate/pantothenate synthetase [Methanomassiliicoccales archaeon]|nr:MAG: phosphopantothenate/pantothenate synthetase [Methanomassiliicoccales archaeon]